ncbi:Prophage CP4-57 integrase [Jannaschia donghaensis]|uniref:Prophage CP4-57 integrase n=1 Tax=Jannaschia donghaensis TaxID=420998 RepID=A0A0M6YN82_9RHOB|nr:Prophage CP4-57 integrase [Jannaschia donghaensis]
MGNLTALFIKSAPPGKHEDGGGLRLIKREGGGGQWVFRYTLYGRRREMGLGGLKALSLKDARDLASGYRTLVAKGKDPIEHRRRQRQDAMPNRYLLKDVALDAFESRKADLNGDGIAGRWYSPLEHHVLPKLGRMPVTEITQSDVRDALAPIWHAKAATATKAANRLKIVLDHAAALGLDVDLQAVAKAKQLLGRQRHEVTSIPSMPWEDVPAFYASIDEPTITILRCDCSSLQGFAHGPCGLRGWTRSKGISGPCPRTT